MGFVLTYGGIDSFGITGVAVDQNGNIIASSNPITNPNANSAGAGGPNTGTPSGTTTGTVGTVFGFNPAYVPKSQNVRTATQLYYYGLLDSTEYDFTEVPNTRPFNQNYQSKKSSVDDKIYKQAMDLATSRSYQYVEGSANTAIKVARLSSVYKTAFTGLYDGRSTLEKEDSVGNSTLIEITASADYYHIPTSTDLHDLTVSLNAAAISMSATLGRSVNVVMPSNEWHGITNEPLHPDGPGNYYPYKTISNFRSSFGIIYDIQIESRNLQNLKPQLAPFITDVVGYWFGNPINVNGPEDVIGKRYVDPTDPTNDTFNRIEDRRDPSYMDIPFFVNRSETNLSQYQLTLLLQTGNQGKAYLPTVKPTGTVTTKRKVGTSTQSYTYFWKDFYTTTGITGQVQTVIDPATGTSQQVYITNAVELLAPKVKVTARLNFQAATDTIFTKGTYSHIEVPKVVSTGDEFTPSVIICHDTKKIYYFVYSYQDNETCVAYNVMRECEEDDKMTYMPLPDSSPYIAQPGQVGAAPPPPPPTPPPPPNLGQGTLTYDPAGPAYPPGGYTPFGFGTN